MVAQVETVHATTIALDGRAALIRGASGSGKSDLALRCLAVPAGFAGAGSAKLVADDQTIVANNDGRTVAVSAPPELAGLIEVRGVGIVRLEAVASARLVLVVDLVSAAALERLPESLPPARIAGMMIPRIELAPFEASAPLKLLLALAGGQVIQN